MTVGVLVAIVALVVVANVVLNLSMPVPVDGEEADDV